MSGQQVQDLAQSWREAIGPAFHEPWAQAMVA